MSASDPKGHERGTFKDLHFDRLHPHGGRDDRPDETFRCTHYHDRNHSDRGCRHADGRSLAAPPAGDRIYADKLGLGWTLGSWVLHGSFIHRPITATPKVPGEIAIGWAFRYAVGIAYAALYLTIMRFAFGSGLTLVSALGICDGVAHSALVCHAAGARLRLHGGTYSEAHCGPRLQRIRARWVWIGPLSWQRG